MSFFNNNMLSNFSMLFQGIGANNLFANIPSMNIGSDLTIKQPISLPNFNNIQAAYSSATTIDSLFNSIRQTSSNPMAQMTSMMPQMSAMGNFYNPMSMLGGIPSMPTPNFTGLGEAPVSADSYMVSLGVAMGIIDPSTLPASAASASTTQPTDSQAAALIKKMPVVSSAKTEEILNKPIENKTMWGGVNQNTSLLSSDGSGATMLNAALPNPEDKAAFMQTLAADVDKEVRLAGRGASKEVVAEVLANDLYSLYEKKVPGASNPTGNDKQNAAYKEKILTGLKNICLGNVGAQTNQSQWGVNQTSLPEGVQEALQILPGISTKDSNPNNQWNSGYGGMMGMGGFGGGFGQGDSRIKMLQEATNSLTASAKENLIKKNSLG